jgi:phage tail-like protein
VTVEFTYLSTSAPAEWRRWAGRNVDTDAGTLGLATEPTIDYTNLRVEAADIAVDRDGNVLVLSESGDLEGYEADRRVSETIWENDKTIEAPRALCVAGDHLYVIDGRDGTIVLVSRRSGAVVGEIEARLTEPIDIIQSERRIYVLDAGGEETSGRVLSLRRNGTLETVIRGLSAPTDLTADSESLYILEQSDGTPTISVHDVGHLESPSIIPTRRTIDDLVSEGTDNTVWPVRIEVLTDRELVLIGHPAGTGDMALYHYTFDPDGGTLTRRDDFPLSCKKLLTGSRDRNRRYPKYYAIAGEQRHVYIVDERQTNRPNPGDGRYSAQAYRRLDAGAVDTGWDRLTLELDSFPANTQVVTHYVASNNPAAGGMVTDLSDVSEEDAETLRGAGIDGLWHLLERDPDAVAALLGDSSTDRVEDWRSAALDRLDGMAWASTGSANQRDIHLENVTGRYLHVKLELVGGVDASPEVGSFRAYCPKQSYLRYLPEYFTRDGRDGEFVERYLSIFESEFVDVEEAIERLTRHVDPAGVPPEYLSWLSDWLAIEYDEEWPAEARREFLERAPTLFKLRGTREGMERTMRLYLNHVERPNTSWMAEWRRHRIEQRRSDGRLGDAAVGERLRQIDDQTAGYPPGHLLFFFEHLDLDEVGSAAAREPYTMHMDGPRSFVTFVGPFVEESHRDAVKRLVATERPAHTHGRVVELRQECKLEGASFLGINSTLTTREFVLGRSTLGGDAVLDERETIL